MKLGLILIMVGFVFNFIETGYFGWNYYPSCPAEMICDYIAGMFIIGGVVLFAWMMIS